MKKWLVGLLVLVVALGIAVGAGALEPQEKSITAASLGITPETFIEVYNAKHGIPKRISIDDVYTINETNSAFTVNEEGGLGIRFQFHKDAVVLVSIVLVDASAPPFELFLTTIDTTMQILFPELNGEQRSSLIADAVFGGVRWKTFESAGSGSAQDGNYVLSYLVKAGNAREALLVKAE